MFCNWLTTCFNHQNQLIINPKIERKLLPFLTLTADPLNFASLLTGFTLRIRIFNFPTGFEKQVVLFDIQNPVGALYLEKSLADCFAAEQNCSKLTIFNIWKIIVA